MLKKSLILIVALAVIISPFSFNPRGNNILQAQTTVSVLNITTNTTWNLAGSPYVITSQFVRIFPGFTLTIDPGVIVKMSGAGFTVQGQLIASGTEADPIIFTSNNDNARGGDTNPYYDSPPQAGDWQAINVWSGGYLNLDHVIINYGGGSPIMVNNNLFHSNSALADGNVPVISANYSTARINDSEISYNGSGLNFYNTDFQMHNSKIFANAGVTLANWSDDPNAPIYVDATNNWWGSDTGPYNTDTNPTGTGGEIQGYVLFDPWIGKPEVKTPVIIVPGIMGSWNVYGRWELDPILHTYDDLWVALQQAGYERDKTLFAFPYQWRLSNSYTAQLLKQKIDEVKKICNCNKVDIVAHSMGGLVTRAYVESNDYQNDINKLIFIATPHRGATNAYLMWEGGEFGLDYQSFILQRLLTVEADFNGYGSLYQYIHGLPMQSVQELLPTYDYLRDKETNVLRNYPNNYPQNTFLEQLNNPTEFSKLSKVNITNIIGDTNNNNTVNNLRVVYDNFYDNEWKYGYPEHFAMPYTDHGLEYSGGDIAVPLRSNSNLGVGDEVIINNTDHTNIVGDAQTNIIKDLTGIEPTQEIHNNIIKKMLMIRIFSPANFVIVSPSGKKLGKDFVSSTATNEIDGAFYSGFDNGPEFATIPNPEEGEYKIELQGTGNGEYKLSTSYIDDNQDVDKDATGTIQTGEKQDFMVNYHAPTDGGTASPISDLESTDILPPVIIINNPIASSTFFHSQNMNIDYQVTDDFSGVATTTVYLDNKIISTSIIDLFYISLGEHTIKIEAQDKAGNMASQEVKFTIVTDIDNTIKDVARAYNLGWISKEKVEEKTSKILSDIKDRLQKITDRVTELQAKIDQINASSTLSDAKKDKKINQLNKRIDHKLLMQDQFIQKTFNDLIDLVNKYFKQKKINQAGYDIIVNDINYLINNL